MTRLGLRTVFLLIGTGLALSLGLLDATVIILIHQSDSLPMWAVTLFSAVIVVVPLLVVGLLPVVRTIEGAAAHTLLQAEMPDGIPEPARSWPQRWRTFLWVMLHLIAGGVISAAVMAIIAVSGWWSLLIVAVTVVIGVVFIALFLTLIPYTFGASASERLVRLEQDLSRAVTRERIARELHDSIGHALSLITVQAAGARHVIDRDPGFIVSALNAIEEASGQAAADLDHALGLLREDQAKPTGPAPDLTDLPVLIQATGAAGLDIEWENRTIPVLPPILVSREAYRIVQEGLTNALRHSLDGTATLHLEYTEERLDILVENPAEHSVRSRGAQSSTAQVRHGRGLRGVAERVDALGGSFDAGLTAGYWRLRVRLPIHSGGTAA